MVALASVPTVMNAAQVPYVTAEEAFELLRLALDRFLAVVEALDDSDWPRPTACTAWRVREMVAHQAGGYASGTGYGEMLRQYTTLPKKGELPEDAVNALQVRERAAKTPAELIAELRRAGPVAIQKWAHQFRLVKPLAIPHPVAGTLSIRHLMWVIHSRDTWMHRLDICRATGREFVQTRDHDGRMVALLMRDVAACLRGRLDGRAVVFDLSGVAGGVWQVGPGAAAAAVHMDALEFSILASGRYSYAEGRAKARLSGEAALAEAALKKILVLF